MRDVASEYRKKGYQVTEHPRPDALPAFLRHHQPDLLASNAEENVIFEFKDKKALKDENYLKELASLIDARPGWRFELIVVGRSPMIPGLTGAKTLSPKDIQDYLSAARTLIGTGQHLPAQLIIWAALEATLRSIAERSDVPVERPGPDYLIKTLYSAGLLKEAEFKFLSQGVQLRNRLVHGFEPLDRYTLEAEALLFTAEAQLAKLSRANEV